MKLFSEIDTASLQIKNFIFHVVHHGEAKPVLLDETPLDGFEGFFLDRIRETLQGNRFVFDDDSPTLGLLRRMSGKKAFVDNSKRLAENFHALGMKGDGSSVAGRQPPDLETHAGAGSPDLETDAPERDRRIKAGVLIVMRLQAGEHDLFSLIKYDHEQVLAYELVTDTRAMLKEIENSFTKSKESLQKSALIRLIEAGGDVIVIDRTVRHDISDFFKKFLGVRRKRTPKEMTQEVADAAIKTAINRQKDLPEAVTSNIRSRTYDAIQKMDRFDPAGFVDKVFGPDATKEIHKTYGARLEARDLSGESFRLNKKAVAPPKEYKYRTIEGVRIQFGENAKGTVTIQPGDDGGPTIITITTQKLVEY